MRRKNIINEPYSLSAQFYDTLAQYIDYDDIIKYIEDILFYREKTPKRILDMGCGTGTAALKLAEKGYQVTGIDLSKEMIALAKEKSIQSNKKIEFLQVDMEEYSKPKAFDMVVSLSDCINHVTRHQGVQQIFRNVFSNLKEGGMFIFDINTPYEIQHIMSTDQEDVIGDNILYKWEGSFDINTDIGTFIQYFYQVEEDQSQTYLGKEIHRERAYKPRDLRIWLKNIGFKNIDYYEAFTMEKPRNERIERVYCIAEKP